MKNIFTLLVAQLFLQVCLTAQTLQISQPGGNLQNPADIDGIVTNLMTAEKVTGLQLGIINKNEPAYLKSYGFKNKAKNEYNDTATSFYGASLSKSLFGFLVMQLVDEGVIQLDKPLSTYLPKPLPEYESYADLAGDERWRLITARQCLDHTTGFPNWRQFNPKGNEKLEIFFTPGSRYAYSGEGIFLLQFVVEIITNRTLDDLAKEKIFIPFGMERSSYIWQPEFESDYAVGHNENEEIQPIRKRKSPNAAGSLQTTIADYTRFIAAILQGKGISAASKKEMLTPQIPINNRRQFPSLNEVYTKKNKSFQLSYALSWGVIKTEFGWAFFKEGHSGDGWQHYTIAIPEKGYALLLMSNSNNGEKIFTRLVKKIAGVSIPYEWEGFAP